MKSTCKVGRHVIEVFEGSHDFLLQCMVVYRAKSFYLYDVTIVFIDPVNAVFSPKYKSIVCIVIENV